MIIGLVGSLCLGMDPEVTVPRDEEDAAEFSPESLEADSGGAKRFSNVACDDEDVALVVEATEAVDPVHVRAVVAMDVTYGKDARAREARVPCEARRIACRGIRRAFVSCERPEDLSAALARVRGRVVNVGAARMVPVCVCVTPEAGQGRGRTAIAACPRRRDLDSSLRVDEGRAVAAESQEARGAIRGKTFVA
jgi:hypothetical protein